MAKKSGGTQHYQPSQQAVERIAEPLARELGLEMVEVVFQKESRGKCLCLYLDKEGGLTLDDCERYHKRVQPLLEDIDYDFLEVSSPGVDRPIKTLRDFEKNRGRRVEVKLFAAADGSKLHQGCLQAMDEENVTLLLDDGQERTFSRKAVAVLRPVVSLEGLDEEEL